MFKVIKDKKEWNLYLNNEFKEQKDVFFEYEYFELYSKHYQAKPEVIYWEDENLKIFWSHLIRSAGDGFFDLTTPYGYGGPIFISKTPETKESFADFLKEYLNYARENKYISEFIRFYPLFNDFKFLENEYLNDVVVVDLKGEINIKKGHKYNVNKTIKEGCEVRIIKNPPEADVDNFIKLYYSAMDKNQADKKYYFSKDFIKDHFKLLDCFLINVSCENKVIGSAIFLLGNRTIHYYLSGAEKLKGIYPSCLIIQKAINWGIENNYDFLHLGGGRGKNDSLFEFKKGFSDLTKPFKIGKIIFNLDVYNNLLNSSKSIKYGNFFPKYRQNHENSII